MVTRRYITFSTPAKFKAHPMRAEELEQTVLEMNASREPFRNTSNLTQSETKEVKHFGKKESSKKDNLNTVTNEVTGEQFVKDKSELPSIAKQRAKGITDVDKDYFNIIQIRTTHQTKMFNSRQYIHDLRKCLRENITTGYFYDQIGKTELELDIEWNKLRNIKKKLSELAQNFETSLNDDHITSMNVLGTAINEEALTTKKRMELELKQKTMVTLRNQIFSLHEVYDKCKASMTFVKKMSADENYTSETNSDISKNPSGTITYDFVNKSMEDLATEMQLQKQAKPKLTFTNPKQIFQGIVDLEIQNRKILSHTANFKTQIQQQSYAFYVYEKCLAKEIKILKTELTHVEKQISVLEQNQKYFEDVVHKLLEQDYKSTIFSYEFFIIQAQLKGIYKNLFQRSVVTERLVSILDEITTVYKKLIFKVEEVPRDKFRHALVEVTKLEKTNLERARNTRVMLNHIKVLQEALIRLFKPIVLPRRKLVFRSKLLTKRSKDEEIILREASDEIFKHLNHRGYISISKSNIL